MSKHGNQAAEITARIKGGGVIHASERTDSMHASIDLLTHKLAKALRRHHEREIDKKRRAHRLILDDSIDEQALSETGFDEEELLSELDQKYRRDAYKVCLGRTSLH